MPHTPLPPEFCLAVACCRWPPSERRNLAIKQAASAAIDWDLFLRVVARHRVWTLAHNGLSQAVIAVPPRIMEMLGATAMNYARQSIVFAREAAQLHDQLAAAGIATIFVKGATLAMLAYDSLALKYGRDIDILVPRDAIRAGIAVLEQGGYRPRHPIPQSPLLFDKWIETAKDFEFFDPARGFVMELHWSLTENSHHAAQLDAHLRTRAVDIGNGAVLPTLEKDVLFVYLCAHGARHGWFRLKWLADVAALLAKSSADDLEGYCALAKSCDMEPCLAQAILLCDTLYPSDGYAALAARLRRHWRYRWLERVALKMMTRRGGAVEVRDIPFGNFTVLISDFFLGTGWRYPLAEIRLRLTNLGDMESMPLPRALWFVYPLLRLPLSLLRQLRSRGLGRVG